MGDHPWVSNDGITIRIQGIRALPQGEPYKNRKCLSISGIIVGLEGPLRAIRGLQAPNSVCRGPRGPVNYEEGLLRSPSE